jgi:hypothetical protein
MTDHPRKPRRSPGEKLRSGPTDGFYERPFVVLTGFAYGGCEWLLLSHGKARSSWRAPNSRFGDTCNI